MSNFNIRQHVSRFSACVLAVSCDMRTHITVRAYSPDCIICCRGSGDSVVLRVDGLCIIGLVLRALRRQSVRFFEGGL